MYGQLRNAYGILEWRIRDMGYLYIISHIFYIENCHLNHTGKSMLKNRVDGSKNRSEKVVIRFIGQ